MNGREDDQGKRKGRRAKTPPATPTTAALRPLGATPGPAVAASVPPHPNLPKLDPTLARWAFRKPAPRTAGVFIARELAPMLLEAVARPAPSLAELPLGRHSLCTQLSTTAVQTLTARELVPVLVEAESPGDADTLHGAATESSRLTRTAMAARVTREQLLKLAADPAVRRIEASVRLKPTLDLAHASAVLCQGGARAVGQTGKGVLVGIVDTGIDAAHPGFQAAGKTRIVDYLDQPTGARYTQQDIDAGKAAASPDVVGHGTHVAGIAAGGGGGMAVQRYAGVAPGADLAVVKTTFDSADIAAGVGHLFKLAEQRKQACVVNLSLGGHHGGHDGSSVTERVIDELCEPPGRAVVVSAGNEGAGRIHAATRLPRAQPTPARWVADFELTQQLVEGNLMGLLWLQVWTLHEDRLQVTLRAPNGELIAPPRGSRQEVDRGKFAVDASHRIGTYSGDNEFTFGVFCVPDPKWLRGWSAIVEEDPAVKDGVEVGAVHAWILDEEMGGFLAAQRTHLVGMPGTAFSAITVASYATRKQWDSAEASMANVDLQAIKIEDVSYFSSPGPTREEQNKPEVAAPGQWLISALSSHASTDAVPNWLRLPQGPYAAMQGTSMAAPYVTGAVALLFEKAGPLHWAEVKRRLIKSCRTDRYSTPCWNARWGYGKIEVERLLSIEPK